MRGATSMRLNDEEQDILAGTAGLMGYVPLAVLAAALPVVT